MLEAYIYSGLRSAFGRYAGAISTVRADDLIATVIRNLVEKENFPKEIIEDVLLGSSNQAGEDCLNVGRNAALIAGLPPSVPGQTVNRLCASGLAAIVDAARAVTCGEGDLYIAGGVESMSRAPFIIPKEDKAFGRSAIIYDTTINHRFHSKFIKETYGADTMPETADNVSREFGISREEQDVFSYWSQQKYEAARKEGFFKGEITPIEVKTGRKTPPKIVDADEHPRPETTLEDLRNLRTVFEGGFVTAGSASGVNDGAAAVFVGNKSVGEKYGVKPMVKILSTGVQGVEPRIMGYGPVRAIQKALARANLTLDDMDIIEINEAFSAQVLSDLKGLNIAFDDPRVNPNGGAIAIGHPLGASGARLALTTARELIRRNKRYAVVALCIGYGQGMAMVIERV